MNGRMRWGRLDKKWRKEICMWRTKVERLNRGGGKK